MNFRQSFIEHAKAGYAGIVINSQEIIRIEGELIAASRSLGREFLKWSCIRGWLKAEDSETGIVLKDPSGGTEGEASDPTSAVMDIADLGWIKNGSVLMMQIMDEYFREPSFRQAFREVLGDARRRRITIVLVGSFKLPIELDKEFKSLDFELPDREFLETIARRILAANKMEPPPDEELAKIVDAGLGLSSLEAQDAYALSLVRNRALDVSAIMEMKKEIVRRDGILEFIESKESLDTVGGLDNLKAWLIQRQEGFSPRARAFGVMPPRGLLICGVPGTGKSLCAKAVGNAWGLPVLRWDVGRSMGQYVGQSEGMTRQVFQLAEALSPCILYMDEFEKMFAGMGSANSSDGGTTQRVGSSFLTWMQEMNKPVFVVATANDITAMKAEMIRRFDAVFAVMLPNDVEREAIWRIHLKKAGRNGEREWNWPELVEASKGFTGSEIEEAVKTGLWAAFSDGERELSPKDLLSACDDTIPLSKGPMKATIDALIADNRFKPASSVTVSKPDVGEERVVELS